MSCQGRQVGHVVIVYNQASGMPSLVSSEVYYSYLDAKCEASVEREGTLKVGRRERYAVARVVLEEDPT